MSNPEGLVERLRDHYRTDVGMSAETADDIANAAAELEALRAARDEAVAALERVTGHLEEWARYHSTERTAETDAAIYCARQITRATQPAGKEKAE